MVRFEVSRFNERKEAFEKELFRDWNTMGKRLMSP
jgi:hypothetical protein